MTPIWTEEDKEAIIGLLKNIADKDFQERAWFNIGPEVSSPDEDICMLYDDHDFENFLNNSSSPLSDTERNAGLKFNKQFNKYLNAHDTSHPKVVFESEDWDKIRKATANLIKIWT